MAGVPLKSTFTKFAQAWTNEVLKKAADQLASGGNITSEAIEGAHQTLTGKAQLLVDDLPEIQDALSGDNFSKAEFMQAGREYVLAQAEDSANDDDRIPNSGALPHQLRADFASLRAGRVADGPAKGKRFSPNVLAKTLSKNGLSDDYAEAVVESAAATDQNGYLNTKELTAAAKSAKLPKGYKYSNNVVTKVMAKYGLTDKKALIRQAIQHHDDDNNKYLKTSELEGAAKVLSGQATPRQIGIISDLDKTVIMPDNSMIPGSARMMTLLEGNQAGDMHYVTARTADRAAEMPEWLDENGYPEGSLDTGVSGVPWLAQAEKVKDISVHFDANPNQSFVLFGDSSHRDPEAYTEILNKYPGRVTAGFIHRVNNVNPNRVAALTLIENYAEAAAHLYQRGVFSESQARSVMDQAQVDGLNITDAQIDALIDAHTPA